MRRKVKRSAFNYSFKEKSWKVSRLDYPKVGGYSLTKQCLE